MLPGWVQRLRDGGRHTIGALPALPVVVGTFALGIAGWIVLPEWADLPIGLAIVVAVGVYCLLRPFGGGSVFSTFLFPGPISAIAAEATGVAQWKVGFPLLALALLMLADQDRDDRARRRAATVA